MSDNILKGFDTYTAEEIWKKFGWGVSLEPGTVAYHKRDDNVEYYIGFADGEYVCEIEVDGEMEGQWQGDDPSDALINAMLDLLHPIAVFKERTEPMLLGLKWCCEDVVIRLANDTFIALTRGLRAVVYNRGAVFWDELFDRITGNAIEMARTESKRWGFEFEDVWN